MADDRMIGFSVLLKDKNGHLYFKMFTHRFTYEGPSDINGGITEALQNIKTR